MDKNININDLLDIVAKQQESIKKLQEGTSKQIEQNSNHILIMYENNKNMEEMKKNMLVFEDKMEKFDEKMERVEYKIDNRLTLDEAQMSEMTDAVRERAISFSEYLNDIGYYKNKNNFGEIVGAVKQGIRAMVKAKFGVNRWFKIREQDYEEAMTYLNNLKVDDFLRYRRKKIKTTRLQRRKSNQKPS